MWDSCCPQKRVVVSKRPAFEIAFTRCRAPPCSCSADASSALRPTVFWASPASKREDVHATRAGQDRAGLPSTTKCATPGTTYGWLDFVSRGSVREVVGFAAIVVVARNEGRNKEKPGRGARCVQSGQSRSRTSVAALRPDFAG